MEENKEIVPEESSDVITKDDPEILKSRLKAAEQEILEILSELQILSLPCYAILKFSRRTWVWNSNVTACSYWDRNKYNFIFGLEFWESLVYTEKLFLAFHETFHIWLDHFSRFPVLKKKVDELTEEEKEILKLLNTAMDLANNHSLLRLYSFDREKDLPNIGGKPYCWVDTVFDTKVSSTLSAEEYLRLLQEEEKKNPEKFKQKMELIITIDDHSASGPPPSGEKGEKEGDKNSIVIEVDQSKEGKSPKDFLDNLKKDGDPTKMKSDLKDMKDSAGQGEPKAINYQVVPKPKKLWNVFYKRMMKNLEDFHTTETWLPNKRRMFFQNSDVMLPSEHMSEHMKEIEIKVQLDVFLDTSGSCDEYKDHFFGFIKTFPKHLFEIRVFGFHTSVYPIDINNPKFQSGGTSFGPINDVFSSVEGRFRQAFIFTDGDSYDHVDWKFGNKYTAFLYKHHAVLHKLPPGCKVEYLDDYE